MIKTLEIVNFCDEVTKKILYRISQVLLMDLQVENSGEFLKLVHLLMPDLFLFKSSGKKLNFLISHHGLFWSPPIPIRGVAFKKIKCAWIMT